MIWGHIHHKAKLHFQRLEEELCRQYLAGECPVWFRPFEGYRSPDRQLTVYNAGTSKALPFQSAHQYGLAVDYVAWHPKARGVDTKALALSQGGRWSWDGKEPWEQMRRTAVQQGLLTPLDWDLPHVEHPIWLRVKQHLV